MLPRSNVSASRIVNIAGTGTSWTERSDTVALGSGFSGEHNNNTLINMWADEDGILIVGKYASSHDHGHIYIGTYKPFPHLTSSIPAPILAANLITRSIRSRSSSNLSVGSPTALTTPFLMSSIPPTKSTTSPLAIS